MKFDINLPVVVAVWASVAQTAAAACPNHQALKASYQPPKLSDGWEATLIANDLKAPRGIIFDSDGGLLVIDKGNGIVHYKFTDGGSGCIDVDKKTTLVNATDLNHGITLSNDGKTLYASTSDEVYAWEYDAKKPSVSDTNQTIVTGMSNGDHTTRTLMMSDKQPGILVVSRGSNSNIDIEAEDLASGRSQIKAFDTTNFTSESEPYEFTTSGRLLGWGLRNSVGVAEEPLTGGIYSVENSADEVDRDGVDIHQNNPAEEMNYHGFLNSSTENQGGNYGYPWCYALWNTSIPDHEGLNVGSQFSLDQNATVNDTWCAEEHIAPRLVFQAHMAPLDIKFLSNGTTAFVTFHGSWDRSAPIGYKVVSIAFDNGSPVAESTSTTAATPIFENADNSDCPGKCFRPVGLALDSKDRLFVSSDASHEIYVLVRTSIPTPSTTSSPSPASTATTSPSSSKPGAAPGGSTASASAWLMVLVAAIALL